MTTRMLLLTVSLGTLATTIAAQHQPASEALPPNPHIDKGACPFECCTYRDWIAKEPITLVNQPGGSKIVARLQKGEKVQALTGEVHSIPLRVVAQRDHPDAGVKRGDVMYILHYLGEGYWKVWHKGKLVEVENISEEGPFPKSTWWVKLKTSFGVVGWTISHGNFSNQDACG